jgi:hypothetical protein
MRTSTDLNSTYQWLSLAPYLAVALLWIALGARGVLSARLDGIHGRWCEGSKARVAGAVIVLVWTFLLVKLLLSVFA